MTQPLERQVKDRAAELGFALCGICAARPSDFGPELRRWLAEGRHGEMDWLASRVEVREDPRKLLEGARSIIMVADRLPGPEAIAGDDGADGGGETEAPAVPGRLARYAWVSDYHKVMKKRLFALADELRARHPAERFNVCVDTAPLPEREHAMRAGLGWVGKHTLLLHAEQGSHLMLGAIVTTLGLPADEPATDHCGSCRRCIDACPTDAITAAQQLDARRCISYLTIEHRSRIDPGFHEAMGDWLYGCDICQDVCPFVRKAERDRPAEAPPPGYEPKFTTLDAVRVLDWSEADRREAFVKSAMKRAKLEMMKRNALIVLGNRIRATDDAEEAATLRRRIEAVAADEREPAIVRRTAQDVRERLESATD